MKSKLKRKLLILICSGVAVVLTLIVLIRQPLESFERTGHQTPRETEATANPQAASSAPAPAAANTNAPPSSTEVADRLQNSLGQIRTAASPKASRMALEALRAFLESLAAPAATQAVAAFLNAGGDAATKLEFSIQRGGLLQTAPTFRVFLLDELARLDAAAAARYARTILATPTSADEWAVAMRNLAASEDTPETSAFLRQKARELLGNGGWRAQPSAGFLEAFDVFVHTRDTEITSQLATLVRDSSQRSLAHAAYLTLDRLAIAAPAALFAEIEKDPEIFQGHELMQSNFFARSDIRDPAQKSALEQYLLSPARTSEELEAFANVYPNANYMISDNLLTRTDTPDHSALAARDRAALDLTRQWLSDTRFEKLKPHLQTIESRLQTFVSQAAAR